MKNEQLIKSTRVTACWVFLACAMLLSRMAFAQNGGISKAEMEKLSGWVGEWKGEGWQMDQQTRQRVSFLVEEHVESKLDGLALVVEGKGTADGKLGHNAMAMIYFNTDKGHYEFHSLIMDGMATLAKGEFNEKGEFIWGFEVPGGEVRFTIKIDGDTWTESGAFSMDGNTWYPTMEMKLSRIK